jgi:hypothetical protein
MRYTKENLPINIINFKKIAESKVLRINTIEIFALTRIWAQWVIMYMEIVIKLNIIYYLL